MHASSSTTYALTRVSSSAPDYKDGELFISAIPSTTVFASDTYSYHFEGQSDTTALRYPASGELTFAVRHEPVIIIPGILGTNLVKNNGDTVWLNLPLLTVQAGDIFMDDMALDSQGMPLDTTVSVGDILRKPVPLLFDYSTGLLNALTTVGFAENKDVFVFPYDWRLSNVTTSQKLANFITEVTADTGSPDVTLIAHSMGGLVAKQYLLDHPTSTVDTLIFVGTPQLGAPEAFKDLLVGDTFGIPVVLDPAEMQKLAKNMPSVYELLPSKRYFSEVGGYFFNNTTTAATAASTKKYLTTHGGNAALYSAADTFHSDAFDTFAASGVTTYNIIGCNTPTIGMIKARPHYHLIGTTTVDYTLTEVAGDGTVPFASSRAVNADDHYYVLGAKHAQMLSLSNISTLLTQIVTNGTDTTLPSTIKTDTSKCVLPKGKLVSAHSPITLNAYDASGNHVGPTSDGAIEENIPGAAYQTVGDETFIFLPEDADQTYTVNLAATASGTFSFFVDTLDNGTTTQSVYYRDIPMAAAGSGSITVSADSSDATLPFDQTGSGTTTPIAATAVLSDADATDAVPPVTSDSVQGVLNASGAYVGSATISLHASDDSAGVLETDFSLDGGTTWQHYSAPITLTGSGSTAIMYRTVDRAGNEESPQSVAVTIASATNSSLTPVTVTNRIYGGGGFVPRIAIVPSSTTSTVHTLPTSTVAVVAATSSLMTTTLSIKPAAKITVRPKVTPVKRVLGTVIQRPAVPQLVALKKPINGRSW